MTYAFWIKLSIQVLWYTISAWRKYKAGKTEDADVDMKNAVDVVLTSLEKKMPATVTAQNMVAIRSMAFSPRCESQQSANAGGTTSQQG